MFGISLAPFLPSLSPSNKLAEEAAKSSIEAAGPLTLPDWTGGTVYDLNTGEAISTPSSNSAESESKDYGTIINDDMLDFEKSEAQLARDFSAEEAAKQRKWLEDMSNSAYSRAVSDIKKAGLNPYMMYGNGGFQASTPAAASAQTVKANAVNNTADAMLISAVINGVANVVGSVLNFAKPTSSVTKNFYYPALE